MPQVGYNRIGDSPELYRLRAMEILTLKMRGNNTNKIAAIIGCSHDTVTRSLQWAIREGLTRQYENELIHKLVPKAISVVDDALGKGDTKAALHIIDKMVKLGERFSHNEHVEKQQGLAEYVANLKINSPNKAKPISGARIPNNDIIDAISPHELPPAESEFGGEDFSTGDWERAVHSITAETGAPSISEAADQILLSEVETTSGDPNSGEGD